MSNLEKYIAEVRERAETCKRSDDFGHDTQALLIYESHEYAWATEQAIPKLLRIVELQAKALAYIQQKDEQFERGATMDWDSVQGMTIETIAEVEKLVGGRNEKIRT